VTLRSALFELLLLMESSSCVNLLTRRGDASVFTIVSCCEDASGVDSSLSRLMPMMGLKICF
jgi:hypothetical protein